MQPAKAADKHQHQHHLHQPTHPPTHSPSPIPPRSILLENSGVAEPGNIRDQFAEAAASGHPLLERIELDTLVTLVDASSFMADYAAR
jgi:G3E family GTPase